MSSGWRTPAAPQRQTGRFEASIIAGVGLLFMGVLSGFGYLIAVKGLVTPGNAARTAKDISAHENLFRFGIVSLFLVAALDVVVAWALYRVFRPVSEVISRFAAWLRIAYAGIFVVAVSQLVEALRLLGHPGHLSVSGTAQLHGQALLRINAFTDIWDAGLVLFGFHLLVIAYLAYRSGYVPKALSVLVAIAGCGYVFDTFSALSSGGSSTPVSSFTFIGEFLLALWLVTRGRRRHIDRPRIARQPDRRKAMTVERDAITGQPPATRSTTPGGTMTSETRPIDGARMTEGTKTMKAVVQDEYGTAPEEALRLAEVAMPTIGAGEILVRVCAASVDRGTWHIMAGLPYASPPRRLRGPQAEAAQPGAQSRRDGRGNRQGCYGFPAGRRGVRHLRRLVRRVRPRQCETARPKAGEPLLREGGRGARFRSRGAAGGT